MRRCDSIFFVCSLFLQLKICQKRRNKEISEVIVLNVDFEWHVLDWIVSNVFCGVRYSARTCSVFLHRFVIKCACLDNIWLVSLTLHAISENGHSRELKICARRGGLAPWKMYWSFIIFGRFTSTIFIDMNAKNKWHFCLFARVWLNNYAPGKLYLLFT